MLAMRRIIAVDSFHVSKARPYTLVVSHLAVGSDSSRPHHGGRPGAFALWGHPAADAINRVPTSWWSAVYGLDTGLEEEEFFGEEAEVGEEAVGEGAFAGIGGDEVA